MDCKLQHHYHFLKAVFGHETENYTSIHLTDLLFLAW